MERLLEGRTQCRLKELLLLHEEVLIYDAALPGSKEGALSKEICRQGLEAIAQLPCCAYNFRNTPTRT